MPLSVIMELLDSSTSILASWSSCGYWVSFFYKLDSKLLPGGDVDGVEDLAKRSLRKFFEDLVLVVDEDLHWWLWYGWRN
jgi:hypothetical protein